MKVILKSPARVFALPGTIDVPPHEAHRLLLLGIVEVKEPAKTTRKKKEEKEEA